MAGSAISVVPLIILFLAFQRRIVAGITLGSVKGGRRDSAGEDSGKEYEILAVPVRKRVPTA